MKKLIAILVMLAIPAFFINAGNFVSNSGMISANETTGVNISYSNGYANIVEQMQYLHIAGYPMLPYKVKTYVFPAGSIVKSIVVEPEKIEKISLKEKIKPAPEPVTEGRKSVVREGAVYSKDEFYPEKWYDYSIKAGIKDGKHVIFVNIYLYPYRYNAVRNEIMHANNFDIKVDYSMPSKPLFTASNYDLLIIAPDQWLSYLQPFVEHKENHGIKTKLVGLSECLTMDGRDDAEKVKYYIKKEIEEDGIKYVMLVGGRHGGVLHEKWWIPVRYTNLDDNSDWEKSYLSDLYFADVYKYEDGKIVFEDWDSNGNGVFAEWTALSKDILDLNPDVYVGRLACRSVGEVKNMVNKIIEYENSNAMQQNWFKRMILVGGDSYNDKHGYIEGEMATWEAYKNMREYDFEPVKVWASEVDLNGDTIGSVINSGAGFAYFCGHGNPMSWSTHRPNDFNSWCHGFNILDMVTKLKNRGMYPVVVIGGCHNSQFNVSIFNSFSKEKRYKGENAPECWSWVFMRFAEKGAIATIGNTGLGYHGDEDSNNNSISDYIEFLDGWLEINFFKNYGKSLGEMHGDTLASYVNTFDPMKYVIDCKVVEEWLLMGDPSLKIGGYAS